MSAARRLLVFVLTSFACIHSHGLEIEVKRNSITVSGPIVEGDFERFRRAVDRFGPLRVELSGPGGLVLEAMRIGRLVRAKGMETKVLGYQRLLFGLRPYLCWRLSSDRRVDFSIRLAYVVWRFQ